VYTQNENHHLGYQYTCSKSDVISSDRKYYCVLVLELGLRLGIGLELKLGLRLKLRVRVSVKFSSKYTRSII